MTTARPVRYRCDMQSQVILDTGDAPAHPRVLELSETGAFIEEVPGIADVQEGDSGTIAIPLPGGDPWLAHIRVKRFGSGRIDVRTQKAEHVSVSVRGCGVEFEQLDEGALVRLRDFLDLIDGR